MKKIGCVQHDCDECKAQSEKIKRLQAELAALKAQGEPVAKRLRWDLGEDAVKMLSDHINGDDDHLTTITLRVGHIKDDDGAVKYGLLMLDQEYPEEGAVLLAEMPAPQPAGNAELERDAKRYRWLLDNSANDVENLSSQIPNLYIPNMDFSTYGWDEETDKRIDAAIAKVEGGK